MLSNVALGEVVFQTALAALQLIASSSILDLLETERIRVFNVVTTIFPICTYEAENFPRTRALRVLELVPRAHTRLASNLVIDSM
jgi:hypothetical protein